MGQNDVMSISEALKELKVGGLTVSKVRGRGKIPAPEIHTSKGSEVFVPQFSYKYVLQVVIPDAKKDQTITAIRKNATAGKIFVTSIIQAIDIESGEEGDNVI